MKKTILISVGVIIVLLILAVWTYLFLYGKPEATEDLFARFSSPEEVENIPAPSPVVAPEESISPEEAPRLYQVTSRPTAGAGFTETSVRYVEEGTGHIYETDLTTRKEKLVSVTTIPHATLAVFSSDGKRVAITATDSNHTSTIVGSIVDDSQNGGRIDGINLPQDASEIAFTNDGKGLHYLIKGDTGSTGYVYDFEKKRSAEVFNIPLRDIQVLWGNPVYIYTTPTGAQKGYLYTLTGKNQLTYTMPGVEGLLAFRYTNGIITTSLTKNSEEFTARTHDGEYISQAVPFIPEKCVQNPISRSGIFCAVPADTRQGMFPDSWYMGSVSYNDSIWNINVEKGSATAILIPITEVGVEIDVAKIGINTTSLALYLINKNDNTLWVFDRRVR